MYLIRCGDTSFYKIGISDSPMDRLCALQTSNPHLLSIELISGFDTRRIAVATEASAHAVLSEYNVRGEWFDLPLEIVAKVKRDMISLGS